MDKELFKQAITHLEKLKTIYETVNASKKDIGNIETVICKFKQLQRKPSKPINEGSNEGEQAPQKTKAKAHSFVAALNEIKSSNYPNLKGTKLDHKIYKNPATIIDYWTTHSKEKILKETTALDLKILYYGLTNDEHEPKGTKSKLFDMISTNIRARKGGIAFSKI
ncbi:hypothetical protein [Alkalihalobacterium elongatum]|uniref:hypothetical protein n=1 Tax=Alkalihalobacterium elongatum TaxID=2675466 RepID=UPI001C1F3762|nr:hypothetical protein [Alkalihalobacterium elongatum]